MCKLMKYIMCFIAIAQAKCMWVNILHIPMSKYTWLHYMRKYRVFLHIFHTTPYNSMNAKKPSFPLTSYAREWTYNTKSFLVVFTYVYILVQIYIWRYLRTLKLIKSWSIPIIHLFTSTYQYNHTYNAVYASALHSHKFFCHIIHKILPRLRQIFHYRVRLEPRSKYRTQWLGHYT